MGPSEGTEDPERTDRRDREARRDDRRARRERSEERGEAGERGPQGVRGNKIAIKFATARCPRHVVPLLLCLVPRQHSCALSAALCAVTRHT